MAAFSASGATGQSVVVDVQSPAKAELIADVGVLRADFGRDAFGWAEIDLPTGEYIVRLGEKLDAKGRIDMRPGGTIRAAEVKRTRT